MEFFHEAKYVRLRSHHDKYLSAGDEENTVNQKRDGTDRNSIWQVEFIEGLSKIRLKSCYNRYFTATETPFLLGWTGKKVIQTVPSSLDSRVEWEPIKDGNSHVMLRTKQGTYLRANGFTKPWKNRVTHDIPRRTITQYWVFWEVEVIEEDMIPPTLSITESGPSPPISLPSRLSLPRESGSGRGSGRVIYYAVGDDNGNIKDGYEWPSFIFEGNDMYRLTIKLEEETGLQDIIVCAHHPFTGRLFPLALDLPPSNVPMHLVLLQPSSKGNA
ncbi:uncharacterized protein LOC131039431 [Cryptomeria japonica]|uniref:uncharacterized protein LOC131039431 n=1 Tax=Cryptomeria japonica TaxID=3369 RepID=UPI0027DA3B1B|nr:uncharacterized protein LOC131039431 [Cryptomeria japonica]